MKAPELEGTICEISWSDEGTPPRVETYVVGVVQTDKTRTDIEHLFVTVELRGAQQVVALQLDEPTARCLFFLAHEVARLRGADAMDWISQLEAKAAERVIADGAKGPTPDYTGEGSAWIPPKIKPHTFAQMVNEVRDLAFDFGTCEQFRDRVSELLGKYVDADGKAPGVVVPEPTGRDLQEMAAEMRIDGDLVDFLAGASKVVLWYRSKISAIPADRVLGEGERKICSEELMYLRSLERYARKHGPESIQDVIGCLDHLRANQGEADHD